MLVSLLLLHAFFGDIASEAGASGQTNPVAVATVNVACRRYHAEKIKSGRMHQSWVAVKEYQASW